MDTPRKTNASALNTIRGKVTLKESGAGIPDLLVVIYDLDPGIKPEESADNVMTGDSESATLEHRSTAMQMTTKVARYRVNLLVLASLVTVCSAPQTATPFGRDTSFTGLLGGAPKIHSTITGDALWFLEGDYVASIKSGNVFMDDDDGQSGCERHACNCRFTESVDFYNQTYVAVVEALKQPEPVYGQDSPANLFGHLLHGVQDFYSHSNWVGTPPQGLGERHRLLDDGVGFWRKPAPYSVVFGDVVLIQGNPPPGIGVRLPTDAHGKVSSAVPVITNRNAPSREVAADPASISGPQSGPVAPHDDQVAMDERAPRSNENFAPRIYRGLMTAGSEPSTQNPQLCYPVGSDCTSDSPDDVCLRHGTSRAKPITGFPRNFDGVGHMNYDRAGGGDWEAARHMASLQTTHEWCRLLHLSRILDSSHVATARLLGVWVKQGSDAHVGGKACERILSRSHTVEVTAVTHRPAADRIPFVLYREDLSDSARTVVSPEQRIPLRICADPNDLVIATLVPERGLGRTLSVTVPTEAKSWTTRDHRSPFQTEITVTVTPGRCNRGTQ